jgi:hypothetical protein
VQQKEIHLNKATKLIVIFLLFILVACLAVLAIETRTKFARHFYDDLILDNWNHYLPCKALPTEAEVHAILQQHQDMILKIEQVNPGFIGTEVDTSHCPGKADLLFWYGSHQDRLKIEALINNNTFFGIPFRLQNR